MKFYNENGDIIDHENIESIEQKQAEIFISPDSVVLELGARYGTVSCAINNKLNNRWNQVSVEPDNRVWYALENNLNLNNCNFHVIKGVISNQPVLLKNMDMCNGYACTTVQTTEAGDVMSYRLHDIEDMFNLKFDTLVADCEGFLGVFFEENPHMYSQLRLIIFEKDYGDICDYDKIIENLKLHNFNLLASEHGHDVWKRD